MGYTIDIMRQSVYLVDSYDFFFNCTKVGQASDLMTVLTKSFNPFVGAVIGWALVLLSLIQCTLLLKVCGSWCWFLALLCGIMTFFVK